MISPINITIIIIGLLWQNRKSDRIGYMYTWRIKQNRRGKTKHTREVYMWEGTSKQRQKKTRGKHWTTEVVLLDGWFCSLLALAIALFVTGNVMIHLAARAPDWVLENQSFVHTYPAVPYPVSYPISEHRYRCSLVSAHFSIY